MTHIHSRQERFRSMFTSFSEGGPKVNHQLSVTFYPSELDRFQEEFPQLLFIVTDTKKTARSKQFKVTVTWKLT